MLAPNLFEELLATYPAEKRELARQIYCRFAEGADEAELRSNGERRDGYIFFKASSLSDLGKLGRERTFRALVADWGVLGRADRLLKAGRKPLGKNRWRKIEQARCGGVDRVCQPAS